MKKKDKLNKIKKDLHSNNVNISQNIHPIQNVFYQKDNQQLQKIKNKEKQTFINDQQNQENKSKQKFIQNKIEEENKENSIRKYEKLPNVLSSPNSEIYEVALPECYYSPIDSFKVNSEILEIANDFVENYQNKYLKEKLEPIFNENKEINMNCLMTPNTYNSYNNVPCSCSSCIQSPNGYKINPQIRENEKKIQNNFFLEKAINGNESSRNLQKINLQQENFDNYNNNNISFDYDENNNCTERNFAENQCNSLYQKNSPNKTEELNSSYLIEDEYYDMNSSFIENRVNKTSKKNIGNFLNMKYEYEEFKDNIDSKNFENRTNNYLRNNNKNIVDKFATKNSEIKKPKNKKADQKNSNLFSEKHHQISYKKEINQNNFKKSSKQSKNIYEKYLISVKNSKAELNTKKQEYDDDLIKTSQDEKFLPNLGDLSEFSENLQNKILFDKRKSESNTRNNLDLKSNISDKKIKDENSAFLKFYSKIIHKKSFENESVNNHEKNINPILTSSDNNLKLKELKKKIKNNNECKELSDSFTYSLTDDELDLCLEKNNNFKKKKLKVSKEKINKNNSNNYCGKNLELSKIHNTNIDETIEKKNNITNDIFSLYINDALKNKENVKEVDLPFISDEGEVEDYEIILDYDIFIENLRKIKEKEINLISNKVQRNLKKNLDNTPINDKIEIEIQNILNKNEKNSQNVFHKNASTINNIQEIDSKHLFKKERKIISKIFNLTSDVSMAVEYLIQSTFFNINFLKQNIIINNKDGFKILKMNKEYFKEREKNNFLNFNSDKKTTSYNINQKIRKKSFEISDNNSIDLSLQNEINDIEFSKFNINRNLDREKSKISNNQKLKKNNIHDDLNNLIFKSEENEKLSDEIRLNNLLGKKNLNKIPNDNYLDELVNQINKLIPDNEINNFTIIQLKNQDLKLAFSQVEQETNSNNVDIKSSRYFDELNNTNSLNKSLKDNFNEIIENSTDKNNEKNNFLIDDNILSGINSNITSPGYNKFLNDYEFLNKIPENQNQNEKKYTNIVDEKKKIILTEFSNECMQEIPFEIDLSTEKSIFFDLKKNESNNENYINDKDNIINNFQIKNEKNILCKLQESFTKIKENDEDIQNNCIKNIVSSGNVSVSNSNNNITNKFENQNRNILDNSHKTKSINDLQSNSNVNEIINNKNLEVKDLLNNDNFSDGNKISSMNKKTDNCLDYFKNKLNLKVIVPKINTNIVYRKQEDKIFNKNDENLKTKKISANIQEIITEDEKSLKNHKLKSYEKEHVNDNKLILNISNKDEKSIAIKDKILYESADEIDNKNFHIKFDNKINLDLYSNDNKKLEEIKTDCINQNLQEKFSIKNNSSNFVINDLPINEDIKQKEKYNSKIIPNEKKCNLKSKSINLKKLLINKEKINQEDISQKNIKNILKEKNDQQNYQNNNQEIKMNLNENQPKKEIILEDQSSNLKQNQDLKNNEFQEHLLNRKIQRNNENLGNEKLNTFQKETITTILLDKSLKTTSEYIDFISNLNQIDLDNQMQKKIEDLIQKSKEPWITIKNTEKFEDPFKNNEKSKSEIKKNQTYLNNEKNLINEMNKNLKKKDENNQKNITKSEKISKKKKKNKETNNDNLKIPENNTGIIENQKISNLKNINNQEEIQNIHVIENENNDEDIKILEEKKNNFGKNIMEIDELKNEQILTPFPNKNDKNELINKILAVSNVNNQSNITYDPIKLFERMKFTIQPMINNYTSSPHNNLNLPSPNNNLGLYPLNLASINNSPYNTELLLTLNGIPNNINNNSEIKPININIPDETNNIRDYFSSSRIFSPMNNNIYQNYSSSNILNSTNLNKKIQEYMEQENNKLRPKNEEFQNYINQNMNQIGDIDYKQINLKNNYMDLANNNNNFSNNLNNLNNINYMNQINQYISPSLNYNNLFDPKNTNVNNNTFNSINLPFSTGFINSSPFGLGNYYNQINNIMSDDSNLVNKDAAEYSGNNINYLNYIIQNGTKYSYNDPNNNEHNNNNIN